MVRAETVRIHAGNVPTVTHPNSVPPHEALMTSVVGIEETVLTIGRRNVVRARAAGKLQIALSQKDVTLVAGLRGLCADKVLNNLLFVGYWWLLLQVL